MRDELKKLKAPDYWVYGVRESEFDYTLFLVRKFHEAADKVAQERILQVRCDGNDQTRDEIFSDFAHYHVSCADGLEVPDWAEIQAE